MSLSQRVRDYRYAKGWGPDELAARAAISRTALYQIESGKTELPRAATLRRIAVALDVTMESLLGHIQNGDGAKERLNGSLTPRIPRASAVDSSFEHATSHHNGTARLTFEDADGAMFAVESRGCSTLVDSPTRREQELIRKLRALLTSPLGEGIATILEESYGLLAHSSAV